VVWLRRTVKAASAEYHTSLEAQSHQNSESGKRIRAGNGSLFRLPRLATVHMDAVGAGPVTKNIARAKMDQNCKRGSSANDRRDSRAGFEATYGSW